MLPTLMVLMQVAVQLGVRVQPETVTVGEPFRVTVRVRAPLGSRIEFPAGPDSAGVVQALDSRVVTDAPGTGGPATGGTEATAVYRLAAWDLGPQPVHLPPITVRTADGDRAVSLADVAVTVRRLTPVDGPGRSPRPPRAVFLAAPPWWIWLGPALAVVAIVALLAWAVRRRRRQRPAATGPPALAVALDTLARTDALGLLDAGEYGRHVALVADALRRYLATRIDGAAIGLTSGELLDRLRADPRVPVDRLAEVLAESDRVRFARTSVTRARASAVSVDARAVIAAVEKAITRAQAGSSRAGGGTTGRPEAA